MDDVYKMPTAPAPAPSPLRVALLTAKMSPSAGGLSVSVPGLAYGLDTFPDVEMHVIGTQDATDIGAYKVWGNRARAFPTFGPKGLQYAPDLLGQLKKIEPDVVDLQGLWTWSSRVNLRHWQQSRKPYVVTPRGMLDPWALGNSAWKKRLFWLFVERSNLNNAHCLRATAEMEAEHFRNLGLRAPVAVVPNAIDIPELKPRIVKKERQILFLSRIHPKKGADILLKVWAELEPDYPDWRLVIAGIDERGHESELKFLARKLGVAHVSFPGDVFGDEKADLYRASDLFVLPTRAENFGIVVAEALAQEVPVITTKNAPWEGLHDQKCGWWIRLEPECLKAQMSQAMSLPSDELKAMGVRGREWIQKEFSSDRVCSEMRSVYEWVANRSPRPDNVYV